MQIVGVSTVLTFYREAILAIYSTHVRRQSQLAQPKQNFVHILVYL